MSDTGAVKKYKQECLSTAKSDLIGVTDLVIESFKHAGGRPAEYPATGAGLERFRAKTIEFFDYVNEVNRNSDAERPLVPDIEAWSSYLGVTRATVWSYEQRGGEWESTIRLIKNMIAAVKKQLGLSYKIPPMVMAFDFTNNHGYFNTNEFRIVAEKTTEKEQMERRAIEEELRESGLCWNEETQEFEPR